MQFESRIAGIPCQIRVHNVIPGTHMYVYRHGDADPPVYPDVEFTVLDRKGYRAKWLEKKITTAEEDNILEEAYLMRLGERYGYI